MTSRVVTQFHEKYHHCGLDQLLELLFVGRIFSNCLPFRKLRSVPLPQLMSDLPTEILAVNEPAFSYTGVDYFGPVKVKYSKQARKN